MADEQRMIGRYKVVKELGRGGMGAVYLGFDPSVERQVAIKVLPAEFVKNPTSKARFEREAKTVAGLEHNAIVPLYDFGEHEGQPYLVMRYMPGGTLTQRIRQKKRLSPAETARILDRLAGALDFAHSQGIVHRDIKPDNVLFDQQGDPFLSDFGIVKHDDGDSALTGTALIGTPAYISPEQAGGTAQVTGASDLYSLGVMAYQMLSGELPYHADTPMQLAVKHITETPPDITSKNNTLDPALDDILRRAMAKDPDNRYANARAFVSALRTLKDDDVIATVLEDEDDGVTTGEIMAQATAERARQTAAGEAAKDEARRRNMVVPIAAGCVGVFMIVGVLGLIGVVAFGGNLFSSSGDVEGGGGGLATDVVAVAGSTDVPRDVAATAAAMLGATQTAEATRNAPPPTEVPETVHHVMNGATNITVQYAGDADESVNFQVEMDLETTNGYYREYYTKEAGYTLYELLSFDYDRGWQLVFRRPGEDTEVVIQTVDLDNDVTNINIRYEDVD